MGAKDESIEFEFEEVEAAAARKVYTVSDLNREIRTMLENDYAGIWVEGEISNFKWHTSGHMYLCLKDEKAQIGAVFFSRLNQRLKFRLEDGQKVLVYGRLSLYEPRGQYQFYIENVEPKGLGGLQLAFNQLKEKLQKEGLFAAERKKRIPPFPRVVGVITSPTGAAIRDILNVMNRRFCGTQVLIHPVRVQGDGAAREIAQALEVMNRSCPDVDVIILGRGGGSLEDLWPFNEEIVARAVFASRIPVISAVGHETDWTICDWVADLRAPTPSAAAELVVQCREELENLLESLGKRVKNAMLFRLQSARSRLEALEQSYALKQPVYLLQQSAQRFDELVKRLHAGMKSVISDGGAKFREQAAKLHSLSPLAVLERGYSITQNEKGGLLKDVRGLKSGDTIVTRLARGRVRSKVTEILKGDENGS